MRDVSEGGGPIQGPPPRLELRRAEPSDFDAVRDLLERAELPLAGVAEALGAFHVALEGERLVGVAGLEIHGTAGVLRSVAVDPSMRGRGLGSLLTERVVQAARDARLGRLYLLTTTAEAYFPRHGFRRIERSEASADVQRSVEFREACPASAVTMVLDLAEA